MARLSAAEFEELVEELMAIEGLPKLQEKLLRSQALVSRRRLGNAQALARQLHQLTIGLERDGLATRVVLALWDQFLASKIEEEAAEKLEAHATRINECLGSDHEVVEGKIDELRAALDEYRAALASSVGDRAARLTMLTRAYPTVARIIRESER